MMIMKIQNKKLFFLSGILAFVYCFLPWIADVIFIDLYHFSRFCIFEPSNAIYGFLSWFWPHSYLVIVFTLFFTFVVWTAFYIIASKTYSVLNTKMK